MLSGAISTVAVIGAGVAGRSFAFECARAGFTVFLEDVLPSNLREARTYFDAIENTSAGVLHLVNTVEDAVRSADIAVDFVPDELESKLEIFSLLDRMAPPRAILCTPTRHIAITDLASCTYRPARCLAVRGVQPDILPLQRGELRLLCPLEADKEAVEKTKDMFQRLGRQVMVESDPDLPILMKNVVYTR